MTKEEAISTLSDIRSEYNCFSHVEGGRYHALSMGIKALKEQKHGKWNGANFHTVECSECGFDIDIMKIDGNTLIHLYHCPNCGADMRGE